MPVRNPNGKNVTQLILSRRAAEVIESQRIKAVAFLRLGGEHLFLSTKNTDGHEISSARNVGFADDACKPFHTMRPPALSQRPKASLESSLPPRPQRLDILSVSA